MFVRIKTTPNSPRKSVQIVQSVRKGDKISQKIVRYVGIAMNDYELEQLKQLAESIKLRMEAQNQEFLFSPEEIARKSIKSREEEKKRKEITEDDYKVNIKNLKEESRVVSGIHEVYGQLFDELDYDKVLKNPARYVSSVKMFKDIVLARIANPKSKMASVAMLEEDFGITLNLDYVYRMMDKLDDAAIERLNDISYRNTRKLFQDKIDVIFFDCTTLYFEAFDEDRLRQRGYSKDMKFNEIQVLFALMVTKDGLPIGYQAFEGSKYEGHTLIPALKQLKERYEIDKVVFVADCGMMNTPNREEMEAEGLEYIVGTRLKNLPNELKKQVTDLSRYTQIHKGYKIARFEYKGQDLIVNYSDKRARKDAYERKKSIKKLQEKLNKQKNPKEYLSNYGYKKFLKLEGKSTLVLDEAKIEAESAWDGLLGVTTNTKNLTAEEILRQYTNLWQVEEAFRINKHDLKVRPVFHWKPSRVRAHIAIAFTAFSLVKYLEYRVRLQYKKLSPEVIRQSLIRVQTSILFDKTKRIRYGLPSRMSKEAKKIYSLMSVRRTYTPYIIEKL